MKSSKVQKEDYDENTESCILWCYTFILMILFYTSLKCVLQSEVVGECLLVIPKPIGVVDWRQNTVTAAAAAVVIDDQSNRIPSVISYTLPMIYVIRTT